MFTCWLWAKGYGVAVLPRVTDLSVMKEGPLIQQAEIIFHVADCEDWAERVVRNSAYIKSTRGRTLEEEGFIHCSFRSQVARIAETYYGDQDGGIILTLNTSLLLAPIKVEQGVGTDELFPHVYGAINSEAIVAAQPYKEWQQSNDDEAPLSTSEAET